MGLPKEGYINPEYQEATNAELFSTHSFQNKFYVKTLKPLRGLGRFRPTFKVVGSCIADTIRLKDPGSLKGLGRKRTFYSTVAQCFMQNKPGSTDPYMKNYNYWRGLRISNFKAFV